MTDSATGGYLGSLGAPPAEDLDLDAILQSAIVGITGLPDAAVIIKGQPVPPQQPGRTLTWCAVGATAVDADVNASVAHDGTDANGMGTSTYYRGEEIDVLASFYGPQCRAYAASLRDGIGLGQNRAALRNGGLAYVRADRMTTVPDLENTQFIRRTDLAMRFRRVVSRTYAIRNVERLAGGMLADAQSVTGPATVADSLNTGV